MPWWVTAPVALFLSTILGAGHVAAWGPEGHAIVAEIAEARLTDAARTQVAQLLSQESHQHLDEVASWADDYRTSHKRRVGISWIYPWGLPPTMPTGTARETIASSPKFSTSPASSVIRMPPLLID